MYSTLTTKRNIFIRLTIIVLSLVGGGLAILTSHLWAQTLALLSSVSWNF